MHISNSIRCLLCHRCYMRSPHHCNIFMPTFLQYLLSPHTHLLPLSFSLSRRRTVQATLIAGLMLGWHAHTCAADVLECVKFDLKNNNNGAPLSLPKDIETFFFLKDNECLPMDTKGSNRTSATSLINNQVFDATGGSGYSGTLSGAQYALCDVLALSSYGTCRMCTTDWSTVRVLRVHLRVHLRVKSRCYPVAC